MKLNIARINHICAEIAELERGIRDVARTEVTDAVVEIVQILREHASGVQEIYWSRDATEVFASSSSEEELVKDIVGTVNQMGNLFTLAFGDDAHILINIESGTLTNITDEG